MTDDWPRYWEHGDTDGLYFRMDDHGFASWNPIDKVWVRRGIDPGPERDFYVFALRGGAISLNAARLAARGVDPDAPTIDPRDK